MDFNKMSDKQRVNSAAMFCYTLLVFILAGCYLLEVIKKSRTISYFVVFLILLLVPYIICKVLSAKDKESDRIKYIMAGGFLIFYLFVIFTTISVIAYVYAIMVAIVLICYNDNKLIVMYMVSVTVGNIAHVIYLGISHQITPEALPDIEIRVASLILFTLFMSMSTKAAELTNQNRMMEIEKEKERVSNLMEQILRVSDQMTENIGTVSQKMEILNETANKTRVSMEEVNQGTGDTVDSIQMQMEKTEEIHRAINEVSNSTNNISNNIEATRKEIQTSKGNIDELIHHVELSNQSNKDVSEEIEKLNEYAEKMQSIIGLINGITSQTSEATINITELIGNVSSELSNMVNVIEDMLHNAEEQNEFANRTAYSFEEIAAKTNMVYQESDKLRELVTNLSKANEQVIRGIETISSATEEVTAHSSETLESTERNSSIAGEVEEIVEVLSSLATELSAVES